MILSQTGQCTTSYLVEFLGCALLKSYETLIMSSHQTVQRVLNCLVLSGQSARCQIVKNQQYIFFIYFAAYGTARLSILVFFFFVKIIELKIALIKAKMVAHCTSHRLVWYFVTKIVLTYCEKKFVIVIEKNFKIRGWRPRIFKIFEITRTIYSNSERSEQFLVTECFFNLFLEVSHI